jgi:predicted dehydrogenase
MPNEKVRLGLLGLGAWGMALVDAAARSGGAEVVNGYSRTQENRNAFEEKYKCRTTATLDEFWKDDEVEGVIIATPHSTHEELMAQAASAGKHLFVEKPMTLTVEGAESIHQAVKESGIVIQVGFKRRRLGATRRIREMIDEKELGMLQQIDAIISGPAGVNPPSGWRNDQKECPVGGMTTMGVHMVDNFHYLAGPVKRVFAFSKKVLGRGNLDDVSVIGFEFESGPLGYLSTSWTIPKIISTVAYGTEAAAWSEEDGSRLFVQKKEEGARQEIPIEAGDSVADQLAEFAKAIRGETTPETGWKEGLEVTAVLQAIEESVKSGKAEDVSHFEAI